MKKWACITGATAGIGAATARRLAERGFNLILLGRRKDRLKQLAGELEKTAATLLAPLDIRDYASLAKFVRENELIFRDLEVLVNNAGLARGLEKMQDAVVEDWQEMIDTNVKGLLYLTRLCLPFLLARGRGHIVNIGSVAGRWVYPGGGVYCATKFAVRALTEGLRMDLLGTPLRVTNVEPGMVETEFSLVRLGDPQKAANVYAKLQPLRAEDIAETIEWVVDRPAHVNVQEIVIYPTDQAAVGLVHRTNKEAP
ncbi:MAG: NAD(P)-dependent oxidoreductase [Bdellovibrio sp.]|nr:MAG: NAD(P)-dependent oxidoreductase [Bdellovibrio sp.]